MPAKQEDRYLVPGLVRGLEVLKLFTPECPTLRLSQIAAALGISRSAAFRTVYTLAEMGCLLHDERAQSYTLGPGVLRLTYGYVATREIVEIAQPELQRLRERTGWSAHLGVLDGTSVLYVLRLPAPQRETSIVQVGSRLPARSTTMGRVLLTGLSEQELVALYRSEPKSLPGIVRQAAQDRDRPTVVHTGDFEAGIVSAAAPVRDMTGAIAGAINLTGVNSSANRDALASGVGDDLKATAARISKLLGY